MKISTTLRTVAGIAIGIGVTAGISSTIAGAIIAGITLKDHFTQKKKKDIQSNMDTEFETLDDLDDIDEYSDSCFDASTLEIRREEGYQIVRDRFIQFMTEHPFFSAVTGKPADEYTADMLALLQTVHDGLDNNYQVYTTLAYILDTNNDSDAKHTDLEIYFEHLKEIVEFLEFRDEMFDKIMYHPE